MAFFDFFGIASCFENKAKQDALSKVQAIIEFKPNGEILSANENFLKALGYRQSEIKGKHHSMFLESDYAKSREYAEFWESLKNGEFQAKRFKRIKKTNDEIWIEASYNPIRNIFGQVYKIVKYAVDVTELVKTEEQSKKLIEEGLRHQQMLDGVPINILLADLDGNIISANPASINTLKKLERLLPIKAEQIIGSSYNIFHKNPEHQRRLLANPNNLPHSTEISIGEEKLDLLITPIFDKDKNYTGPMLTWSIVTEQRKVKDMAIVSKSKMESEVLSLVDDTKNDSEELQKTVCTVVTATEEMISSIQEISKNTTQAADMSGKMVDAISSTEAVIGTLEQNSKEIEDIVKTVTTIANQTNLLALNATIEAARAGEAGKGFTVVANEVKDLAAQTSDATEKIKTKIESIQMQTKAAMDSIKTSSESVKSINHMVVSIASAVEEQTAVTNEIGKNMNTASSRINNFAGSIQNIQDTVQTNIALIQV